MLSLPLQKKEAGIHDGFSFEIGWPGCYICISVKSHCEEQSLKNNIVCDAAISCRGKACLTPTLS